MECNSFFSPEIIESPAESPFFRSGHVFYWHAYDINTDAQRNLQAVNVDEWQRYIGVPDKALLSSLLYKMPLDELNRLVTALEGGSASLGDEARALKAAIGDNGRKESALRALAYLRLAKQVEPIATRQSDTGWAAKKKSKTDDPAAVAIKLIDDAEESIKKSDRFLAQRYRLQVLRLMFYTQRYADAQKYFEDHKADFVWENSAKYRFMDLGAGAYYKGKQYGKANYLYSVVFDRFAPLKQSVYFSFHPVEEADWREALGYAKSDRERQVLWQLVGIYVDGMAAIDQIYTMDPKSNLLPLLLVREVNKAEEDWTSNQDRALNGVGKGNGPKPDAQAVGIKRLERIKAIADAAKTYKPHLWLLATGHLYALAGDARAAEQYLNQALKALPDVPELKAQVRMSLLFARVRGIKAIDKQAEPSLAEEFAWLQQRIKDDKQFRARTLNTWALAQLSRVYLQGGDYVRSLMLTDATGSDVYRDIPKLEALIQFRREPKTAFDRFLVSNYGYRVEQLQELKGINSLYAAQFKDAVDYFRLAGAELNKQPLNADPFMIHINDCHDCDFAAPHTKYTKLGFAERMFALSKTAQGRGQEAAQASMELANGFYNMSYYGNGRDIYETGSSNFDPGYGSTAGNVHPALNMDLAEKYYLQAMQLSTNKEFRAKAVFMAAKAEQNRYYNEHPQPDDKSDIHPGKYYKLLKDTYADTQYYQEIIRECGYFATYVGKQ